MGIFDYFRRQDLPGLDAPSQQIWVCFVKTVETGSPQQLVNLCRRFRPRINELFDEWRTPPEEILEDTDAINRHMRILVSIAECYAKRFAHAGPMDVLTGPIEDNPFTKWQRAMARSQELAADLDYDAAIEVLREALDSTKVMKGPAADQHAAIFQGRIGECLFNSGRVGESLPLMESALETCIRIGDQEGIGVYLNNLIEVHRYLGNTDRAAEFADRFAQWHEQQGRPNEAAIVRKWANMIRAGEPLNRVVIRTESGVQELDELTYRADGHYRFEFLRNRRSLALATSLTDQGKQLAADGSYADAIELFQRASDVDAHDPDPPYQQGMCLMEMGLYEAAGRCFDETERLAPGWFHCRTDGWLAGELAAGRFDEAALRLYRAVEDGGLTPEQVIEVCELAVPHLDDFAPLWLAYGSALNICGRKDEAQKSLQRGLNCCDEPDLVSRINSQLAVLLPEGPEKQKRLQQAATLNGNFIAAATARIMMISQGE